MSLVDSLEGFASQRLHKWTVLLLVHAAFPPRRKGGRHSGFCVALLCTALLAASGRMRPQTAGLIHQQFDCQHSGGDAPPRQKVRLVVSSGKECRRLKRIWQPNFERVPVPVRSPFKLPVFMMSPTMSRYCSANPAHAVQHLSMQKILWSPRKVCGLAMLRHRASQSAFRNRVLLSHPAGRNTACQLVSHIMCATKRGLAPNPTPHQ